MEKAKKENFKKGPLFARIFVGKEGRAKIVSFFAVEGRFSSFGAVSQ